MSRKFAGSLRFKEGGDFGDLLLRIAREHLFSKCDPVKAVDTIQGALAGCTYTQALDIFFGRAVLVQAGDALEMEPVSENAGNRVSFYSWVDHKVRETADIATELIDTIYEVSGRIEEVGGDLAHITISLDDLVRNPTLRELCRDSADASPAAWLVEYVPKFVDESLKLIGAIRFCASQLDGIEGIEMVESLVKRLQVAFHNFCTTDYTTTERVSHAKTVQILDAALQCMNPVDIEDGYDACWVAPNGKTYGINGPKWAMLHINLSERILEMGYIEDKRSDPTQTPDAYLEQLGYVKLHKDHVLFAGCAEYWEEPVDITPQQVDALVRYAKLYHNGRLRCGFSQRSVSTYELQSMDRFALRRLFNN